MTDPTNRQVLPQTNGESAVAPSCDRQIGPFPCCSVVLGDCLELMKSLPDGCVDAVVSDPPYGVANNCDYTRFSAGPNHTGGTRNGAGGCEHVDIHGDDKPFDPSPWLGFGRVILWGFPYFADKVPIGTSLIWLKRYDDGFGSFLSDAEIAWMNSGVGVYVRRDLSLQTNGEPRNHPTQKPIGIMEWCIERAGNPDTILDPFCGSGTTLVAAKKLGRHFLGFEISPEYCAIARDRLARIDAQPSLFQPKAEQLGLEAM